jgi:uncharacterized protein (TIGR03546 family)
MSLLVKFLKALNSESSPWQIAIAITFGMLVGFTPLWRLHNVIILLLVLFFRVNIASFIVSVVMFSALSLILNPLILMAGDSLLVAERLMPIWTWLYNTPLGQLSQFYHSLTMGGLTIGLLLAIPILLISRLVVIQYREKIMAWVNKLKVVQVLKSSSLFQLYQSMES